MAEKVKGIVKVVKQNDYKFYSIKIDDTWYGTGSKQDPGVAAGDYVEGEYTLEKEKYKTITKAGLKKVQAPAGASPPSSGGGDKMSKAEWAEKDSRIQYQHAQKVAATLIANPAILEAAGVSKAKQDAKLGIIETLFDKYTAQVFADVATFGAVARANGTEDDAKNAPPTEDDDE